MQTNVPKSEDGWLGPRRIGPKPISLKVKKAKPKQRIIRLIALFLTLIFANCRVADPAYCSSYDATCNPLAFLSWWDSVDNRVPCQYGGSLPLSSYYTFLGATGGTQTAKSVCGLTDGSVVVAGDSNVNIPTLGGQTPLNAYSNLVDFFVVKLSSAGSVEWYTFLGGTGGQNAFALTNTTDGGFVIVGNSSASFASLGGKAPLLPYGGSTQDGLVVKLNSTGSVDWWTFLGGAGIEQARAITAAADGGVLVLGNIDTNLATLGGKTPLNAFSGLIDILVVKLNSSGGVEWHTALGGTGIENVGAAVQATDGGIFVAGYSAANITTIEGKPPLNAYSGGDDGLTLKLNATGNIEWFTFFGGAGGDRATSVTRSGTAFGVVGSTDSDIPALGGRTPLLPYSASDEILVLRMNSIGSIDWYTFLGGAGDEESLAIAPSASGFVMAGSTDADIPTLGGKAPLYTYSAASDFLVTKLTLSGSVDWYTFLGGIDNEQAFAMARTADDGFAVAGSGGGDIPSLGGLSPLNAHSAFQNDFLVVKIKPDGTL